MLKQCIQFFLGLNAAAIVRGLRLGPDEFFQSCYAALGAVYPFQDRELSRQQRELKTIPLISLDDILSPRKAPVRFTVQEYEDGMLPSHEAMMLLSIMVAENPREVLEIGTFMGHTTRAMAENLENGIIHTVDLPLDFSPAMDSKDGPPKDDFHLIQRRVVGREFQGKAVASRIRQHLGDSAKLDFQALGRPTFFFIDGSHTYEHCKLDSEKCFQLCKGAGTFLWHDCNVGHPGVLKFIVEWRALGRNITRIHGTAIAYWKSV